jgi:hypothetical protein
MAAATPMAGAPRTTMVRMASATASYFLQLHPGFLGRQLGLVNK